MKPRAKVLAAALGFGALVIGVALAPVWTAVGAANPASHAANTPYVSPGNFNASALSNFGTFRVLNFLDHEEEHRRLLAANKTVLDDGRVLSAAVFHVPEMDHDPIEAILRIDGIPVESRKESRSVIVRGTALAGATTPAAVGAGVTLSAYALLLKRVSAGYLLFIPRVGAEVVVAFEEGNPDNPLIIGSVYDQKAISGLGLAQASLVSGASEAALLAGLASQLGLQGPCGASAGQTCNDVAITLDVSAKGNLVVHVFQGNGPAPAGSTVNVCLQGQSFSATTDQDGSAQFNGPSNTILVNAQTSFSGISVQVPKGTGLEVCTLQGTPCSGSD